MITIKVIELAKEKKLTTNDIFDLCDSLGIAIKGEMSVLNDSQVKKIEGAIKREAKRKENFCLMKAGRTRYGRHDLVLVDTEMTAKGNYAVYDTDLNYISAYSARSLKWRYQYAPIVDVWAVEKKIGKKLVFGEDNPFLTGD